ncbi:proline racemase [Colletotrichum scovillei]|uniref:Proline racemase n=1 Tax=Colletotrichum scovillei TaxID=1209932 RepID=A0A9P7UEG0_9PEZI|nr:proline racemase [Colletotrichum scovillei]KAF4777201.1 proline racemase [Colletotrichum scovillei]KAG7053619.1 proline racemase [Colletotrichum scovillei]KAG7071917.1 proline racemase [Colletotrichum scovillei]KAG7080165.1 proline racemase [Colletotrichum scovillei]
MTIGRTFNVVGAHCGGEVCDVIVGGVLDVPGKTMFEKMMYFWKKADHLRNLLMNEPRGSSSMCVNLVLPPCNPEADAGFIIMEHEEYPPMSGANTIAVSTVLLETGMVPMQEPATTLRLDTPAGLVTVKAECKDGKVTFVEFQNVPAFVYGLDLDINVPGFDTPVKADIAWGGMWYALVDAGSVGLQIKTENGKELVDIGERIKRAIQKQTSPVHPENPEIRGVSVFEFTDPLSPFEPDTQQTAVNTVVVSPGRLDRSPCGTGTCARLAVLHKRGQLAVGGSFRHRSVIGTEFIGTVKSEAKVGDYDAIIPVVKGTAWITAFKQVILHPTDPFPEGFRVGDKWHVS